MEARSLIDPGHAELSIATQCGLLGLPRSTYYYAPKGETPLNLNLMRLIDEQYLSTPYYGAPKMTAHLQRLGCTVNHKRVERLMKLMGLRAATPRPWLSQPDATHRIYPYLLRDLAIERPNQVWCSDITYIRLAGGFVYLVAVMDWFSRYVLAWELSNTLDVDFCLTALYRALRLGRPEIFNTDQGSQFTSHAFTDCLLDHDVRVSMDGRGRAYDNIFIERLWRSVKYEEVYLHDYRDVPQAYQRLGAYFEQYNRERLHENLGYRTPTEVHFDADAQRAA
ncbi:MAG: putative transposase [Thermodesulfobacteriota bacterium]|nr:putative transposase [Thermodesulfobacteriota bacterium]